MNPVALSIHILLFISCACGMEAFAWFAHKYIMHGFLWVWHKDHHVPHKGIFEKNDIFVLLFATPAALAIILGIHFREYYLVSAGAGITLYGISYTLFHDIMFHRRIKALPLYKLSHSIDYFASIVNAHRQHHKHMNRQDTESFGFLYAPKRYRIESEQKSKMRKEAARIAQSSKESGLTIVSTKEVWKDSWLSIKVRNFKDRHGKLGAWSYVERQQQRQAAVIVARTPQKELLVIKQYRIPFCAWVYEFPAGLVDPGEDIASAALRELKEETGYEGTVNNSYGPLASSAGLSTEQFYMVSINLADIAGDHAREGAEAIEVYTIPKGRELDFIKKAEHDGHRLDGKLYTYLCAQAQEL